MAIPTDGLVFYAPLAEDKATAETGQTMSEMNGEILYINADGVPCGIFDDKLLLIDPVTFPSTSFTMSIWYYRFKNAKTASFFSFGLHVTEEYGGIALRDEDGYLGFDRDGGGEASEYLFSGWTHCLLTYSQNTLKIYANGNLVYEASLVLNIPSENQKLSIGGWFDIDTGYYTVNGHISSARFYNRVLSESEIQDLANEFNEDSGGSGSGNTGFLIDGLFLSSSKPKLGQKGLLLDNKYFLPLVEGGGSAEYYKCASVDTSAKTWTGYRAVLNGGVYTFEDTVTTGLSYTSVTPQVGKIYSQDALVYISSVYGAIPTDGLVFYAPLAEDKTTAETGQILTKSGDITYSTYGNMPYAQMTKEAAIYTEDTSDIPAGSQCRTWSFYIKFNSTDANAHFMGLSSKSSGTASWYYFYLNTSLNICLTGYGDDNGFSAVINKDTWYHICLTYCGKVCSAYINGIFASDFATANDLPKTSTYFMMGNTPYHFFNNRAYEGADCCLSSVRIYNRVLNTSEIAALASEFTPTQVNT